MSFKLDSGGILNGLNSTVMKTQVALNLYGDTVAKKLESDAKTNAPWIDRTGQARQRLNGTCKPNGSHGVRIELSHAVDYGVYLEFCNGQQNEILGVTLDENTPSIIRGMNNLLGK
ncbi:MAG: hypothetical protein RSC84_02570 [Peptostreptococcaceae bacterium]|uniref:hypothetical protein n=1 Tax=Clostridium sp. TaxID=1506 RepID=UPI003058CBD7